MGLTPDLSIPGRIVVCLVMFVGRMGPLFLISAVKKQEQGMWYAEEDIMVG
jgi:trk system potassium uptake protein TrkH